MNNNDFYDVIIVGGGMSGLCAAKRLKSFNNDLNILILENQNDIGGRTKSINITEYNNESEINNITLNNNENISSSTLRNRKNNIKKKSHNNNDNINNLNNMIDLGGMWIGSKKNQKFINELITEYNIKLKKQYNKGKKIIDVNNKISNYTGSIPSLSLFGLIDLKLFLWKIESKRKELFIPKEMYKCDAETVESYMNKYLWTNEAYQIVKISINAFCACEPNELSLYHFLNIINSAGGIDKLINTENGFQEYTLVGGMNTLIKKIENDLYNNNVEIKCNCLVTNIIQNNINENISNVTLKYIYNNDEEYTVSTSNVIITVPSPLIMKYISFEPSLPTPLSYGLKRSFMGSIIKIIILYNESFWKVKNYSGEVISDCKNGPIFNIFDYSNDNINGLVCFINGEKARDWIDCPDDIRKEHILDQLSLYFGPESKNPIKYIEYSWDNNFIGGAPVCNWPTGILSNIKHDYENNFYNIYWAGTEHANKSKGFIDGAVQSGYIAADLILSKMNIKSDELMLPKKINKRKQTHFEKVMLRTMIIFLILLGISCIIGAIYIFMKPNYIVKPGECGDGNPM